jgi:hypothetical protein
MIAIRVLQDSKVVREVVSAVPLTIGREPGSAVVLADGSVSRTHARIEHGEDGQLRVVDLGSRNGLYVDGRKAPSAVLDRRLTLRLGQTELEVEPVSDSPTLEIPATAWRQEERRRGTAARLGYLAVGVAGILASQLLQASFWSPWNHTRWVGLLFGGVAAAVALPLVAGLLFLVLKVVGRRVRLADTLRALGLLSWLVPATNVVLLVAYYPLSPSQYALFQLGLGAVAAAATVAVLASVRREPRSSAFTLGWAAIVLVFVAGFMAISAMTSRERGLPDVDLNLQAPLAGYAGRAESFDDYLGAVRQASEAGPQAAPAKKGRENAKPAGLGQ